jgi:ligand-binding sensor domain-containing protein
MRLTPQIIGSFFLLLIQACNVLKPTSPPFPLSTITLTPATVTYTDSPPPTSTQPIPTRTLPPPTPTTPALTLIKSSAFFFTKGYSIQPSNSPDKWLLYDSPRYTTVLLFDGKYIWAGSADGGLVQWDTHTLSAVRYTNANGFPLRAVNDLAFDEENGYLYAVGDSGLAIWDGTQWKGFTSEQLGFLLDEPLNAIAVEAGTIIWVGAQQSWNPASYSEASAWIGGGLVRGDWRAGNWESFNNQDPLLNEEINDLAFDSNGNLWVASGRSYEEPTTGGIAVRDTFERWSHWGWTWGSAHKFDRGLDGYGFSSLAISPDGRVYAGGSRGVSWLEPDTDVWQSVDVRGVHQLSLDAQGRLWMATDYGLHRLDVSGLQFVFQRPEYNGWLALAQDGEANVWFGGSDGLFRLRGNRVEQMPVLDALPGYIFDVAVNGDDTVWTRSDVGISHLVGDRIINFAEEKLAIEAAYPWSGLDTLWPVATDGTLWLLMDNTLWGYNQDGWKAVTLDTLSDEHIYSYTAGRNGALIIAGSIGLHIYKGNKVWQLVKYPQGIDYIDGVVYNSATNTIWARNYFLHNPGKVVRFNLDTGDWTFWGENPRSYYSLNGIGLSSANEIWAASTSGSLVVYRSDGTWQSVAKSADFLGVWGFGDIHFGNSGDIWLTTIEECGEWICSTGLVYYDGKRWQRFTAENSGLYDNRVYDVSVDSLGNAWLATETGLQQAPFPPP